MKRSLLYILTIILIFSSICYTGEAAKNNEKNYVPCEWKVPDFHFRKDKRGITWISRFMHKDSGPSSPEFMVALSYNFNLEDLSSEFKYAEKLAEYNFPLKRKKAQIIIFKQAIPSAEAIANPSIIPARHRT